MEKNKGYGLGVKKPKWGEEKKEKIKKKKRE